MSVYKAFLQAKALCMHEMGEIGHLHVTQPWAVYEYEAVAKVNEKVFLELRRA